MFAVALMAIAPSTRAQIQTPASPVRLVPRPPPVANNFPLPIQNSADCSTTTALSRELRPGIVLKTTIAAKIFGLAILLLCLTIALSAFLLWQVTRLNVQLKAIVSRYQPLTSAAANLDEYGLRRRLAFERWFGALNSDQPNEQVISEAKANYAIFSQKISAEISHARALANAPFQFHRDREVLTEVRS